MEIDFIHSLFPSSTSTTTTATATPTATAETSSTKNNDNHTNASTVEQKKQKDSNRIKNTILPANNISTKKNTQPTCPKYQYYQSDAVMTISILESNVQPENLSVKYGGKSDHLTVILSKLNHSSSSTNNHNHDASPDTHSLYTDFTVICGTLFDAVDVPKCTIKFKDEKVLIKLKKKQKGDWHELFGAGDTSSDDAKDHDAHLKHLDNSQQHSNVNTNQQSTCTSIVPPTSIQSQ